MQRKIASNGYLVFALQPCPSMCDTPRLSG